jgi:hypothetical protein
MSDKLKTDLVDVEFVAGEQPSYTKLTLAATQLKTAINRLGEAVGDLFTQQTHAGSSGTYTLEDRPTVGPNMSRLLGSSGWLNPRQQGRIRQTYSVIFAGSSTDSSGHWRRKIFKLPYPAIVFKNTSTLADAAVGLDNWRTSTISQYWYTPSYDDATWAISPAGGAYTDVVTAGAKQKIADASRVSNLDDLNVSPEYYCDYEDGVIYLAAGLYGDFGAGDTIGGTAPNMTLTDATAKFHTDIVGCNIQITSSTTPANDGIFVVTGRTSETEISYTNAAGVAEVHAGYWSVQEGFKITYQCDTFSDSYDGATFNVIPDQAQTDPLCTVTLVSGSTYNIVTPNAQESRGRHGTYWTSWNLDNTMFPLDHTDSHSTYDSISPTDNPLYTYQIELPRALTENLSSGDPIPDGYIQIWDDTNQAILAGGSFYYTNSTTVQCVGLSLTASTTRYRLIVPGTNALSTLYHLRQSYFNHRHTGKHDTFDLTFDGHKLAHSEMLYLFDEGDNILGNEGFFPSIIGPKRNPHPQYLHRYGWGYHNYSDTANLNNALAGHLVLTDINSALTKTSDSFGLHFGNYGSGSGGQLYFDQGNDQVELLYKPLDVDKGISAGPDSDVIKWFRLGFNITTNPTTLDFTSQAPSDFVAATTLVVGAIISVTTVAGLVWRFPGSSTIANDEIYISNITWADPVWQIQVGFGSNFGNQPVNIIVFYV